MQPQRSERELRDGLMVRGQMIGEANILMILHINEDLNSQLLNLLLASCLNVMS